MTNAEAIHAATADMTYEEKLLVYRMMQELAGKKQNAAA